MTTTEKSNLKVCRKHPCLCSNGLLLTIACSESTANDILNCNGAAKPGAKEIEELTLEK